MLVAKITLKKQHKKMDPKQPPKKPVISAKLEFAKKKILKFAPTLFLLHRKIELETEVRVLYKNNILKQKNVHTVDKRKCSV